MKTKPITRTPLILLITGLMLVSMVPLLGRYYAIPDLYKGVLTGIGLALEIGALIKMSRDKKSCGGPSILS